MTENDEDAERVVSRRDLAKAGVMGAGLAAYASLGAEEVQADHTTPSEPLITLGDSFELFDSGDDAVIKHTPSGAHFTYNQAQSRWEMDAPLHMTSQDVTGVGALTADERTINKVGGRGESNSIQSINSGAITQVELDAVDFEDADVIDVDTTNDKLIVKKAGKILMIANIGWNESLADGTRVFANLKVNTTSKARVEFTIGASVIPGLNVSDIKDLSVNDDILIEVFQDTGEAANLRDDERVNLSALHGG